MSVSVPLRFIPPEDPDYVMLHILESSSKLGPFTEIDSVVVAFPNYPSEYTTALAASLTDWFAIQWEDDKGALSEMSSPLQGGTESLVGVIVQRMLLRDSSINANVAAQEAEAAISEYFNVLDPSTIDPTTVSPTILNGLTLLAMVWSYYSVVASTSQAQKFTAGLVSLDTGTTSTRSLDSIDRLLKQANQLLNRNYNRILRLAEPSVSSGYMQLVSVDISRTLVEYE